MGAQPPTQTGKEGLSLAAECAQLDPVSLEHRIRHWAIQHHCQGLTHVTSKSLTCGLLIIPFGNDDSRPGSLARRSHRINEIDGFARSIPVPEN